MTSPDSVQQQQQTGVSGAVTPAQPALRTSGKKTRWSSCNILDVDADVRRLWQFDAQKFLLSREQTARNGEQLPPHLIAKSWGALFQHKLNVAWLPPENVFLRVAQFPMSNAEETRSMVELQLEKLSPVPVTQAVWTMHVLPQTAPQQGAENLQTIIITVVSRDALEQFLGKLEGQGYMADRLELPMLDQLQATRVIGDGAWVYPETRGLANRALVAWWYGGMLRNLAFLTLETGPNRVVSMKDQLVQMTWAGELEGWLTSPPHWHLVAETGPVGNEWQSVLREALDQPIEMAPPVPPRELAALTARRAADGDATNNLLPIEFATRYQQEFVDRLWGRGLLAALVIYGMGLAIFFIALAVFSHVTDGVQAQAQATSQAYTNSIQLTGMLNVLKERETLKFAALDCWEAVAETLPTGLNLDTLSFNDGTKLSLRGTAPADQVMAVTDFYDKLRKWETHGEGEPVQPLFNVSSDEGPRTSLNGGTVTWSFDLDIKPPPKR